MHACGGDGASRRGTLEAECAETVGEEKIKKPELEPKRSETTLLSAAIAGAKTAQAEDGSTDSGHEDEEPR